MRDGRPRVSSRRLSCFSWTGCFPQWGWVNWHWTRDPLWPALLDMLSTFSAGTAYIIFYWSWYIRSTLRWWHSAVVPQFWILVWVSLSLTRMILMILSMIKPNLPAVGSMSIRFYPANLPMNLSIKGYWFENEVPMNPQNWHFGWSYTIQFCGSLIFTQTHIIIIFRWLG